MRDKKIIRTEILRRRKAIPKMESDERLQAVYGGIAFELTELLSFIDSMQEEPTTEQNIELEEEIENWLLNGSITDTKYDDYCDEDIRDTARHFAKWQKEQMEKASLAQCDTLSEEDAQLEADFVDKFMKENNRVPTIIDAIKYGKEVQKEEMMKEANTTTLHHYLGDGLAKIYVQEGDFKEEGDEVNNDGQNK